jgi:hypothetical protein
MILTNSFFLDMLFTTALQLTQTLALGKLYRRLRFINIRTTQINHEGDSRQMRKKILEKDCSITRSHLLIFILHMVKKLCKTIQYTTKFISIFV